MQRFLITFLLVFQASAQAAEGTWTLSAEEWARPRAGASLVDMAPLREAVTHLNGQADRRLIVAYPGGEEGSLWAHELRSWLVALGVPSRRIQLVSGASSLDGLDLRVEEGRP